MIILLLLILPCLIHGEQVRIDTLSPTASTAFWSSNGIREVEFNRNLAGNQISIGGQKFTYGIAGHSGMSLVYNIDGMAERFTAVAGIDDELFPGESSADPVDAVLSILADRHEVYRQTVNYGKAPIPIDINLSGKLQFELRFDYGKKSFIRQRIAIGNPCFETTDSKALANKLTQMQHQRRETDNYRGNFPPIPQWKKLQAEYLEYHGFKHALKLGNPEQEVIILPEFGGRIIYYGRPGGGNLLYNHSVDIKQKMRRGYITDNGGGHFIRTLPRYYFLPQDVILQHGQYDIEFGAEGEVILRSPISPVSLLGFEYRLHLTDSRLKISNCVVNGPLTQEISIWPITRIATADWQLIMLPEERPNPGLMTEKVKNTTAILIAPNHVKVTSPLNKRDFAELKYDASEALFQIIYQDTTRLSISYDYDWNASHRNYPLHLYISDKFTELESHGPNVQLPPNTKLQYSQYWSIEQ